MGNYLETIYFRDEYGEDQYPQKLCNYVVSEYFGKNGDASDKKLLDIGSGKGNHLVGFGRHGIEAYGLDKRSECIEINDSFTIKECNLEEDPIPFEDNYFDFIFSKSVLEHVTNADNFLSEVNRLLKPGGIAVLLTPDWKSQQGYFWDDYTHVKAWTRKGLQDAMVMHNFDNVTCDYFLQLPFVWKYKFLSVVPKIVALVVPERFKWKDKDEKQFRTLIRFSKEKMLLTVGTKGA